MSDVAEQRYGPTSGVFTGVVGLVGCAAVVVVAVVDGLSSTSLRFVFAAGIAGVLVWAYMLRPRVVLEAGGRTLLLRNPFVDLRVPLAAVRTVGVRAVTTVKTEEERFDCVAVGYPVRRLVRGGGAVDPSPTVGLFGRMMRLPSPPPPAHSPRLSEMSVQEAMTEQVLYAADQARLQGHPEAPVERRLAVPELVVLGGFLVAFVVALLV